MEQATVHTLISLGALLTGLLLGYLIGLINEAKYRSIIKDLSKTQRGPKTP